MLIHASMIRKFMQVFPALNSYNFTKDGESDSWPHRSPQSMLQSLT